MNFKFLNRSEIFIYCIIFYIVLLLLKLNGFCDYTAKYDIEEIQTADVANDFYHAIDGDLKRSWGHEDIHKPGDKFTFIFTKNKKITKLDIINQHYIKKPSPNIEIFSSQNSIEETKCEYIKKEKDNLTTYEFPKICSGKYLILKYANQPQGFWPLTEIMIYE